MNRTTLTLYPYDAIPLDMAGYVLGGLLLLGHLIALIKRDQVQKFLLESPRNHTLAQILLGLGLGWFFLLVAPQGLGPLSALRVDLAEFEHIRWALQIACPVFLVLMIIHVKELLFPRALGICALMAAAPLLSAAYLKEPVTRLLIPLWCYAVIFVSFFWIAKPYLYRNMVNWVCSKKALWTPLCLGGMAYGAAILICAILWW